MISSKYGEWLESDMDAVRQQQLWAKSRLISQIGFALEHGTDEDALAVAEFIQNNLVRHRRSRKTKII